MTVVLPLKRTSLCAPLVLCFCVALGCHEEPDDTAADGSGTSVEADAGSDIVGPTAECVSVDEIDTYGIGGGWFSACFAVGYSRGGAGEYRVENICRQNREPWRQWIFIELALIRPWSSAAPENPTVRLGLESSFPLRRGEVVGVLLQSVEVPPSDGFYRLSEEQVIHMNDNGLYAPLWGGDPLTADEMGAFIRGLYDVNEDAIWVPGSGEIFGLECPYDACLDSPCLGPTFSCPRIEPLAVDFGYLEDVSVVHEESVRIHNCSDEPIVLEDISQVNGNTAFRAVGLEPPVELDADASIDVRIETRPRLAGAFDNGWEGGRLRVRFADREYQLPVEAHTHVPEIPVVDLFCETAAGVRDDVRLEVAVGQTVTCDASGVNGGGRYDRPVLVGFQRRVAGPAGPTAVRGYRFLHVHRIWPMVGQAGRACR